MDASAEHASAELMPSTLGDDHQPSRSRLRDGDDAAQQVASVSAARLCGSSAWVSMYSRNLYPGSALGVRAVLKAAMRIEPNSTETTWWYLHTPIAELGGLTAAQLVLDGRVEDILRFLHSVQQGKRD